MGADNRIEDRPVMVEAAVCKKRSQNETGSISLNAVAFFQDLLRSRVRRPSHSRVPIHTECW